VVGRCPEPADGEDRFVRGELVAGGPVRNDDEKVRSVLPSSPRNDAQHPQAPAPRRAPHRQQPDDAILATWATVAQWEAIANAIEPTNQLAFQVRVVARRLRAELDRGGLDPDMLADSISLASLESELAITSLQWLRATEEDVEEQF
jgi:hypothetical protein